MKTRRLNSPTALTTVCLISFLLSGCSGSSDDSAPAVASAPIAGTNGDSNAGDANAGQGVSANTESGSTGATDAGSTGSGGAESDNTGSETITSANSCVASPRVAANTRPFLGNIYRLETKTDERFHQLWNQVTPENVGKWNNVEPGRNNMIWTSLDDAVNFAADFDYAFRLHTLISGTNQPAWMAALSVEEQEAEIVEWFDELAARYIDIQQIDVVSNPIASPPTYINALGGTGVTGWDWIIRSFELARARFPNSDLLLNNFNVTPEDGTNIEFMEIVSLLKDRNLIDGVGIEGHFFEEAEAADIKTKLDLMATLGVPMVVASLDINIADDQQQLEKMQEIFPVFYDHPSVEGVTFWGYRQNQLWRKEAYLVSQSELDRPALDWLECYVGKS